MEQGGDNVRMLVFDDGHGQRSIEKRSSLSVPEDCGFDFQNAFVCSTEIIDLETGDIDTRKIEIVPERNNFKKIVNDWQALRPLLEEVRQQFSRFPMERILCYIDNLTEFENDDARVVFQEHKCRFRIIVNPLTASGNAKKKPISIDLRIMWSEPEENWEEYKDKEDEEDLYLSADYFKDGTFSNGVISYSYNRSYDVLSFFQTKNNKEYRLKKLTVNNDVLEEKDTVLFHLG